MRGDALANKPISIMFFQLNYVNLFRKNSNLKMLIFIRFLTFSD